MKMRLKFDTNIFNYAHMNPNIAGGIPIQKGI